MSAAIDLKQHPVIITIREEYILRKLGTWFGAMKIWEILQEQDIGPDIRSLAFLLAAERGQQRIIEVLVDDCKRGRDVCLEDLVQSVIDAKEHSHWVVAETISNFILVINETWPKTSQAASLAEPLFSSDRDIG